MLLRNFEAFGSLVVALIVQNLHREFGVFGVITDDSNHNGICKKRYRQMATRYVSYREVYSPSGGGSLRLTQWNYRTEAYPHVVLIDVCCDGYELLPSTTDLMIQCIPVCKDGCLNGKCIKSDVCECDPGYRQSISHFVDHVTCEPDCPSGCVGGHCVAPATCTCDDGYVLANDYGSCHISCSSIDAGGPQNCGNDATCVAPNQCKCNDGYMAVVNSSSSEGNETASNDDDDVVTIGQTGRWRSVSYHRSIFNTSAVTCAPFCKPKCGKNSNCAAPGQCRCMPGYEVSSSMTSGTSNDSACLPVCDKRCVNGYCGEPNKCYCHEGYKPDPRDDSVCVAVCKEGCVNGLCTRPDHCECNEGYEKLAAISGLDGRALDNACAPICSGRCSNGWCIAPGHCICNSGYVNVAAYPNATDSGDGNAAAIDGIENDGGIGVGGQRFCRPLCEPGCPIGQVCTAPNRCQLQSVRHRDLNGFGSDEGRNVDSIGKCDKNGVYNEKNGSCGCHRGWTGPRCTEPTSCAVVFDDDDNNHENLTQGSVVFRNNASERHVYVTDRRQNDGRPNWESLNCNEECRMFVMDSKNTSNDGISCHKIEFSNATDDFLTSEISDNDFPVVNETVICFIDIGSACNIRKSEDVRSRVGAIATYSFLFVLVIGLGSVAIYFIDRKIRKMKAMRAVQRVNAFREQAEATESLYATDESSHV